MRVLISPEMKYFARDRDGAAFIDDLQALGMPLQLRFDVEAGSPPDLMAELGNRAPDAGTHYYSCGPTPMLRAVAQLAAARDVPCQVSLEGYMACGVGACLGCVAEGHNHSQQTPDFRCVCTEGPVFDSRELKWE